MQHLLPEGELQLFLQALDEPAPVSIRFNPAKRLPEGHTPIGERVAWCREGLYLSQRPVFTLDPAFHAGAYYVQEASSMFLGEALRQTVDRSSPLKVLDLCAAPGGKSTLIADFIGPDGLLVANETIRSRVGALRENMEKWGYANVAITSGEAEDFARIPGLFDVVVTDAPCSGEGMFRKDPDSIGEWSPENVSVCSSRQKRILAAAVDCLKPGGILIYSTCTYNREENGGNIEWLAGEFPLELLQLEVPGSWQVTETGGGYQFYPHKTRGEGFFLAVLRKTGGETAKTAPGNFKNLSAVPKSGLPLIAGWINPGANLRYYQTVSGEIMALPDQWTDVYAAIEKLVKLKWFGVNIGEFKGKDLIPAHALALSSLINPDIPYLDTDRAQALRFLKKESIELPDGAKNGWTLVRFHGLHLGWIKVIPGRMNNYLPQERRIRMDITD
jgi:16S rRNA C967 or C1407 C5-methylase (RsmB/RsmF family)/NOL1/NOP2/fmu family ribosome biogenesis protein